MEISQDGNEIRLNSLLIRQSLSLHYNIINKYINTLYDNSLKNLSMVDN